MSPDDPAGSAENKVLVLNFSFDPVNICRWQRALILLFKGKAELVAASEKLINRKYTLPHVIRLARQVRIPRQNVILTRKNIYLRDNHTCQYCGKKTGQLTVDHIMPRSRGGVESWQNMVAACVRCNNKKGKKTPAEAGFKLRRTPFRPPSMLYLEITRLPRAPECWYHYFTSRKKPALELSIN
jgi:5-methylcytosine-specific restriction endonuclease McrA